MMSARMLAFVVFASSFFCAKASSVVSATAAKVATTEDLVKAAEAALGTHDSEAYQLSSATEQQKFHDHNSMWDGADAFDSVGGSSQKRNASTVEGDTVDHMFIVHRGSRSYLVNDPVTQTPPWTTTTTT